MPGSPQTTGARGFGDRRAVEAHALAVALHLQLLEIGGEAAEPLVVGDHRLRRVAQNVAIPHRQQPHKHGDVLAHRRGAEMFVHVVAAGQELLEALGADGDGERQADARPDRIAPADPIPEAEHPRAVYAELAHLLQIGRHRDEMVADRALAQRRRQPLPRRARVGHGLQGREGLRRDDEHGSGRVEAPERVAEIGAIDVGDEMAAQLRLPEGRKRPRGHRRPEIGAADADVDDVGERLAEPAAAQALAHIGGEGEHAVALLGDIGREIVASDHDRRGVRDCAAPYAARPAAPSN